MNHESRHVLTCALLASSLAPVAFGQGFDLDSLTQDSFGDSRDVVNVAFTSDTEQVTRGGTVVVDVTFEMKRTWHIWPQEGGAPQGTAIFDGAVWTEINVVEAEGLAIGSIDWPETHQVPVNLGFGPEDYAVFEGTAVARVELLVAADAPDMPTISLSASFQACDDSSCLAPTFDPPTGSLSFKASGELEGSAPPS